MTGTRARTTAATRLTGCAHVNNTNDCDDGNDCTEDDTCTGGACTGTSTTLAETTGLVSRADKARIDWSQTPFADDYDVVRGDLKSFPIGSGGVDEVCFNNLSSTSVTDNTQPTVGNGFWYLARAQNSCGTATWGTTRTGRPRISTICP